MDILNRFRVYWYKQLLNEAVEISLTKKDAYNIKDNILGLLTDNKITYAIYGEPMTYAFTSILRELNDNDFEKDFSKEVEIKKVEKQFSPKNNYI